MPQPADRTTAAATQDAPWTTRTLLAWMRGHFESRGLDAPRVVADMLLAHILGCERMRLYMEADRPASPDELDALRELVRRAAAGEPVHLLTGRASFFGRDFLVEPCTQIPQPCTEAIVEAVLRWHRPTHSRTDADEPQQPEAPDASEAAIEKEHAEPAPVRPLRIAEIGVGSGAIAVSLAAQIAEAEFIATDVRADVLDLARRNAERFGVADRIELRLGPTWAPFADDERFDAIVSNPPYIPDHEWPDQVDPSVRAHIAASALRGGSDGLDVIRPLIAGARDHLESGGLLAVEIAASQHDAAHTLAVEAGLERVDVLRDEDNQWRTLVAHAPDTAPA